MLLPLCVMYSVVWVSLLYVHVNCVYMYASIGCLGKESHKPV